MKNILTVSALIACLGAGAAFAQKGPPTEEQMAARLERMKAHLELTDEQVEQIRQIRADGGRRDEIRAVLTPEQQEKMDQAREARKARKETPADDTQ